MKTNRIYLRSFCLKIFRIRQSLSVAFQPKRQPLNKRTNKYKIMIPTVPQLRERILTCRNPDYRTYFQALYLLCARADELAGLTSPCETLRGRKAHAPDLAATLETYTPDPTNPDDAMPLILQSMMNGTAFNFQTLAQTKEQFAVFTIYTLKRKGGWFRSCALPMNPLYEPWTQYLYDYITAKREAHEPLWPFTQKQARDRAKILFDQYEYEIMPYVRKVGDIKQQVNMHKHPFRLHGPRHIRATELEDFYAFTPRDMSLFGGWTPQTKGIATTASGRYTTAGMYKKWRPYAAKLLKKRPET